eukprot:8572147-Pyramimonas_sp.AAC.1
MNGQRQHKCSTSPRCQRLPCPVRLPSPASQDAPAAKTGANSHSPAQEAVEMVGTEGSGVQHQVLDDIQIGKRCAHAAALSCVRSPSRWPPS